MANNKIVRTVIQKDQKPTLEQIEEIKQASEMEFIPDEDAPELTLEQYAEMAELAKTRRSSRIKTIVSL